MSEGERRLACGWGHVKPHSNLGEQLRDGPFAATLVHVPPIFLCDAFRSSTVGTGSHGRAHALRPSLCLASEKHHCLHCILTAPTLAAMRVLHKACAHQALTTPTQPACPHTRVPPRARAVGACAA